MSKLFQDFPFLDWYEYEFLNEIVRVFKGD